MENMENPIRTKIFTIGSRIKNELLTENACSKTEIQNSKQTTKILHLGSLYELTEIVESMNTGQISNLEYLTLDSSIVKLIINVVDGKLIDESRTCFLASIGTFHYTISWFFLPEILVINNLHMVFLPPCPT
jgi:hypothetical protein